LEAIMVRSFVIRTRLLLPAMALILLTGLISLAAPRAAASAPASTTAGPAQALVLRVIHPSPAQLTALSANYDLLEARSGADYFVLGDGSTAGTLRSQGLQVRLERALAPLPRAAVKPTRSALQPDGTLAAAAYATFYGGYHTVDAQLQHLRDVAAAYPSLATVVDYGDSWRKTQGLGGSDLLAICITKINAGDCARSTSAPKPRSVVVAAIHARELATSEIAWNWIDYLTQGYGTDATITALLNSTEIWVIPVINPDGRKIVESGGTSPYFQRKNANTTRGNCANPPTATNQSGVDLNRNATFHWGGVGSSTSACAQEYRGLAAASEPETQAAQGLFNSLFADHRGSAITDAAPVTTTGTFMTYHSYAGLVLYPWGDVNTAAPNGAKLRALAQRMAAFNGYTYGQPGNVLYNTSGTTDDDLYGRLGVAAFTTELGAAGTSCDGFMPPYSCVASRFWPQEQKSLMVLAQAAAGPYR
jgi:carboxypeptidase T